MKTRPKPKRRGRAKAKVQDAGVRADEARAADAAADAGPADQSRITSEPAPSNLYSDEDWRRIKIALEAYERIDKDSVWARENLLKVIGPELVYVREVAFKVAGTRNPQNGVYKHALGISGGSWTT